MIPYLRATGAIALVLVLIACAATTADVKPNSRPSATVAQNPACVTETGSRIATKNADCVAFGRSYSSDDIDRTGATTAGEALPLLDPSITVHR
jgi:hypothetical protein